MRDAFANYQLNNSELVRLARAPERFEEFCKTETRDEYTPAQLDQALDSLGLMAEKARLEGLQEPWGERDCGVYRRLGALSEGAAGAPGNPPPSLARAGLALFDRLDTDKDGRLGASELEEAMTSDQFHGREAACCIVNSRCSKGQCATVLEFPGPTWSIFGTTASRETTGDWTSVWAVAKRWPPACRLGFL
ncbi:hypothetical protein ABS71_14115 [bacterium SCN 62-11]|nr:MAG: hypothetical protein ABS71_14115 [bacterium SCN 62-11]